MEQYIFKKKTDGINIINLKKTWEKLVLAAGAIAAVENPQDVFVVASRPYAQRAVLKFARYIGCSSIAGRFTPGAFTNQIQAAFREPRLLLISDPRSVHQRGLPHQVHRHRRPLQQQEPPEHRLDVVVPGQGSPEAAWFNLP